MNSLCITATPNRALQRTAACVTACTLSAHYAGAAPHSAVAELGVVGLSQRGSIAKFVA